VLKTASPLFDLASSSPVAESGRSLSEDEGDAIATSLTRPRSFTESHIPSFSSGSATAIGVNNRENKPGESTTTRLFFQTASQNASLRRESNGTTRPRDLLGLRLVGSALRNGALPLRPGCTTIGRDLLVEEEPEPEHGGEERDERLGGDRPGPWEWDSATDGGVTDTTGGNSSNTETASELFSGNDASTPGGTTATQKLADFSLVSRRHVDIFVQRGVLFDHACVIVHSLNLPSLKRIQAGGTVDRAVLRGRDPGDVLSNNNSGMARAVPLLPADTLQLLQDRFPLKLHVVRVPISTDDRSGTLSEPLMPVDVYGWSDKVSQVALAIELEHQILERLRDELSVVANALGSSLRELDIAHAADLERARNSSSWTTLKGRERSGSMVAGLELRPAADTNRQRRLSMSGPAGTFHNPRPTPGLSPRRKSGRRKSKLFGSLRRSSTAGEDLRPELPGQGEGIVIFPGVVLRVVAESK
jgi:hypothetical protein